MYCARQARYALYQAGTLYCAGQARNVLCQAGTLCIVPGRYALLCQAGTQCIVPGRHAMHWYAFLCQAGTLCPLWLCCWPSVVRLPMVDPASLCVCIFGCVRGLPMERSVWLTGERRVVSLVISGPTHRTSWMKNLLRG